MSSKRGVRRKACSGKRRFDNGADAGASAQLMRRGGDSRMEAYRCHFCGGWHLGHRPRKYFSELRGRRP